MTQTRTENGSGHVAVGSDLMDMNTSVVNAIRPLGSPWESMDPFLFCAHHNDHYPPGNELMGPAASLEGRHIGQDFGHKDGWSMYHGDVVPGFPAHPHRGFETVTIVTQGFVDHCDSLGAAARYGAGDVQWLTAGSGIQHSEMFPVLHRNTPNPLELFQIWLNLPRVSKTVEPHFSMLWHEKLPHHIARDDDGRFTEITVIAGQLGELKPPAPPPASWAIRPDADVAIWVIRLAPDAQWTLPAAPAGVNRMLYYYRGSSLRVGDVWVRSMHSIVLQPNRDVLLKNTGEPTELLLLQGRPIEEPVAAQGPFVMNSQQEVRQAYADYRRTHFGGWSWPVPGPVHPRTESRFARHADGRLERPGVEVPDAPARMTKHLSRAERKRVDDGSDIEWPR